MFKDLALPPSITIYNILNLLSRGYNKTFFVFEKKSENIDDTMTNDKQIHEKFNIPIAGDCVQKDLLVKCPLGIAVTHGNMLLTTHTGAKDFARYVKLNLWVFITVIQCHANNYVLKHLILYDETQNNIQGITGTYNLGQDRDR